MRGTSRRLVAHAAGHFGGSAIRKQSNVATTNDVGLVGLSPSPATDAHTETFLRSQNPTASTGGAGRSQIGGHGANAVYTRCSLGF